LIQQSDDAKKLFAYLLLTCKNVSLYPEGHSISSHSIEQLQEMLVSQIRQRGDIRIEVEKNRVLFLGIEVHKGSFEEGTLPFTLFRDGIRWIELTEGLRLEETRDLLSIINKYSVLTKEPEGDIVTALWEAHFDHVLYQADDFVSEQAIDCVESIAEWDAMHAQDNPPADAEEKKIPSDVPAEDEGSEISPINPDDFLLTSSEKIELQEMISREEILSESDHLNMLLDMLLQVQEEGDFNIVLGVLSEEFEASYQNQNLESASIILDGLRKIVEGGNLTAPADRLIESFYTELSSDSRCLKPLENTWSQLNARQIEAIRRILQHLRPKAVPTLMHFLLLGQPSQLEKTVNEIVVNLAHQDLSCLESLVHDRNDSIAEKLVFILSRIEGDGAFKFLMKLARRSSTTVRRMALKEMALSHGNQIPAMFEFIDDPDPAVRQILLTHMAQSRNEIAENLLIHYIQNKKFTASQNEHVLECLKTLGKCGSLRSVSFLSNTLLRQKWTIGLKKPAYCEGAALALVALKLPEAQKIIESLGRSFYPGLRGIARKAGKEFSQNKKRGH
jgi:hypothetical protein